VRVRAIVRARARLRMSVRVQCMPGRCMTFVFKYWHRGAGCKKQKKLGPARKPLVKDDVIACSDGHIGRACIVFV